MYFTTNSAEKYAVNGLARALADAPDIEAIWADSEPDDPAPKVSIGSLIDAGLEICDRA